MTVLLPSAIVALSLAVACYVIRNSLRAWTRNEEARAQALRTELAWALSSQRRELQESLDRAHFSLETRVKDLSVGVQEKLEKNLKEGFLHFEKVETQLQRAERELSGLGTMAQSIQDLNNLLKLPHLRGGFGERILEQLLSDCLPQGAYELQYRVVPDSTERVDAVVKYPQAVLPIDSKFPREQVLALFESAPGERLEAARKRLTEIVKGLARQIQEKYIHPEHGTTEMALLFVPSETLYFEILRHPALGEELSKRKVFAVSPNTLTITLQAIALSRRYYEMAKGVEKTLSEVRKARDHFEHFERRFEELGSGLEKAQSAFHTATTHLTRYQGAVSRLLGEDEPRLEGSV